MSASDRKLRWDGFTLFELIIVLAIISAMVAVIMPYATRSNNSLKMKQECLNIAEAIKYAINLSMNTRKPTRIVIDPKSKTYSVEAATEIHGEDFKLSENFPGAAHYLGQNICIINMDGFSIEGKRYYLVFDPARAWPCASISISTGDSDAIKIIKIRGKQVEIEDSAI